MTPPQRYACLPKLFHAVEPAMKKLLLSAPRQGDGYLGGVFFVAPNDRLRGPGAIKQTDVPEEWLRMKTAEEA